MKLASLEELFIEELRDLYDAEKQITKALPEMAEAASSRELKTAFQEHLEQTRDQMTRLERVFEELGEKPEGNKCEGMEGLLDEGKEIVEKESASSVKDAALIASAQKVEHYEIAGYGCVRTYAEVLGYDEAAELLQRTLKEEEAADERLTQIAEGLINKEAAEAA